jgi:hypothetical protein
VDGVDPRVRLDPFDFEPRDRDCDPVGGDRQRDRSLRLDVVEPGEVVDAPRVELDGRLGGGIG